MPFTTSPPEEMREDTSSGQADLVREPSQYPWSSYLAYVKGEKGWEWLERQFILAQLSLEERKAQRRYQGFVRVGMLRFLEDPLKKVVASTLLGTERFIEEVFGRGTIESRRVALYLLHPLYTYTRLVQKRVKVQPMVLNED